MRLSKAAAFLSTTVLGLRSPCALCFETDKGDGVVFTGLEKPEDLFDLEGTDFILASAYAEPVKTRDTRGTISLLRTDPLERVALSFSGTPTATSEFSDPTCNPLDFDDLGAHGLDARPVSPQLWEVAVVNHFERESIEFFLVL